MDHTFSSERGIFRETAAPVPIGYIEMCLNELLLRSLLSRARGMRCISKKDFTTGTRMYMSQSKFRVKLTAFT